MTQHSNPDEKLLDEILHKVHFDEHEYKEGEKLPTTIQESLDGCELVIREAKQAILSNFVSKDKVRKALKDEPEDPTGVRGWWLARNQLRSKLRSKLGVK